MRQGKFAVNVHFYEDGNVQSKSNHEVEASVVGGVSLVLRTAHCTLRTAHCHPRRNCPALYEASTAGGLRQPHAQTQSQ